MRVALINPFKFQTELIKKNEPISLSYLKSYLENRSYSVEVFDFELIEDSELIAILSYIANDFDVVGISCYYPYIPTELSSSLKNFNEKIITIAGGPMASLKYKELLYENSPIDFIIVNEGEQTFFELLEQLKNKYNCQEIQGVANFYDGQVHFKPRSFIKNLDELEYPKRETGYYDTYIPTIISSRGCNGRCTFCSTRYMGRWRGRTPEHVFEEILHIVNEHSQTHFQFVEPNFLENIQRASNIADLINNIPQKLRFDFACRVDSIISNEECLKKLVNAGASKVLLGIENFDNKTLESWKKDINLNQIRKAFQILNKIELNYSISLILFHPTVTKEDLIRNIEIIDELNICDYIENLFNFLRLIPGTSMNPSTKDKNWNFENKDVSTIFINCIEFEKISCNYSLNIKSENMKIKDNYQPLKNDLLRFSNIKRAKLNFLKNELGMRTDLRINYNNEEKIIFTINPYIKITSTKINECYDIYNLKTGLKYNMNESAMLYLKILDGNTFKDVIDSFCEEIEDENYINDFLILLKSLILSQILKCEVH